MITTAEQMRTYEGPAILSYGFRPFFLFGAIWAALAVAIWLPMLAGSLGLPTAFAPVEWHAHELLYGYLPAIVAGFLLTAVPNWTGRLPVTGRPLLGLLLIWVAG
ncbi:MAG TPA: NnrS family protein, partial [Hyphomicrobiaceae bacterium]